MKIDYQFIRERRVSYQRLQSAAHSRFEKGEDDVPNKHLLKLIYISFFNVRFTTTDGKETFAKGKEIIHSILQSTARYTERPKKNVILLAKNFTIS